jgi:hypothetical protein
MGSWHGRMIRRFVLANLHTHILFMFFYRNNMVLIYTTKCTSLCLITGHLIWKTHLGFNSLTTTDTTAQMIIPVYQNEFLQAGL